MTDKLRTILVIFVVILQILFFAGWYAHEAGAFNKPIAQIKVKTISYDPRSLLSGQYIRLTYSFSNPRGRWDQTLKKTVTPDWSSDINNANDNKPKNQDIWVVLYEIDGFYEPKTASYIKPTNLADGEVVIQGRRRGGGIEYGIEKYFVPEGTKEPKREDTTVELNIYKNGKSRINQVFVNDKVWP